MADLHVVLTFHLDYISLQVIPERMPDCSYFLQGAFCYIVLLFIQLMRMRNSDKFTDRSLHQ